MDEPIDIPSIPGYLSIKEAANKLGISDKRIYAYINSGRLKAVKASHIIMISSEELDNFKPNITGRPRKSSPPWRIPPDDNKLRITFISVQVRSNLMNVLMKRLEEIKQSEGYIFPGTVARYIAESETIPGRIEIELVWRGALPSNKNIREQSIEELRQKLADVLDWSTAKYSDSKILLHT